MKLSNTVVTIVVIAAVLISAYGVGLLIHRARMGDSRSAPAATEANEAARRQATENLSHGPGTGKTQDSPEMRAQLKEKRAEILDTVESATDEQKEQYRQRVRERFSTTRSGKRAQGVSTGELKPAAAPGLPQDPNSEKAGVDPNAAG